MIKSYGKLFKQAEKSIKNSYSPYSGIKVGAAVLAQDGNIYSGANVENASYGLTMCAERTAIFKAVSEGNKKIVAVAVASNLSGGIFPCGACLQVISEFSDNADIVLGGSENKLKVRKMSEFLPLAFNLGKKTKK